MDPLRWMAPALAVVLASCGSTHLDRVGLVTASPATLDFGVLLVGQSGRQFMAFTSHARDAATFQVVVPPGFIASPSSGTIEPGVTLDVALDFAPVEARVYDGQAVVNLQSATAAVELRARGASSDLDLPTQLSFGGVPLNTRVSQPLTIHSRSEVALQVYLEITGDHAFQVTSPLKLEPGATADVDVTYQPTVRGPAEATLRVAPCDGCSPLPVQLTGTGAVNAYTIEPLTLDFGVVLPGSATTRPVRIDNGGDLSLAAPVVHLTSDDGVFALPGGFQASPLAAGDGLDVPVTFTPMAEGTFTAVLALEVNGAPTSVPITGKALSVQLVVDPSSLDFGQVPLGATARKVVNLVSLGVPIHVAGTRIDRAGPFVAGAPGFATIGTDPVPVEVRYRPNSISGDAGELLIDSDDPAGILHVPLSGTGIAAVACRSIATDPPSVRFGAVPLGRSLTRTFDIQNLGADDCQVWEMRLEPALDGFTTDAPEGLAILHPGGALRVSVTFAPSVPSPVVETTAVRFRSGPADIVEPLSGQGILQNVWADPPELQFGTISGRSVRSTSLFNGGPGRVVVHGVTVEGSGAFSLAVPLPELQTLLEGENQTAFVTYAPSGDAQDSGLLSFSLGGVDEPVLVPLGGRPGPRCDRDCPPVASCPGPIEAAVRDQVPLLGVGMEGEGGKPSTCTWSILSAPEGSVQKLTQDDSCQATLVPDLFGDYLCQMQVTDSFGNVATCATTVTTVAHVGLWAETDWNAPDDVDVHLFHPTGGDPALPTTWFSPPWDCFFDDDQPSWDQDGTDDDPSYGKDIKDGTGTEEVSVKIPSHDHDYDVGVHWFSDTNGNTSLVAVTRISCDDVPVATVTSQLPSVNTAVFVGRVRYNGKGDCTFDPDGTSQTVIPH